MHPLVVNGHAVSVQGRLCRRARLRDEGYDFIDDPENFGRALRAAAPGIDLFSFAQGIADPTPKYPYRQEWDELAVLQIEDYEHWWQQQISHKIRNMVRKAAKSGVAIRTVAFDHELVRAIKTIYDENPLRQGKPFKHFGKDLDTLYRDHATYLERSEFIGAFADEKLIGFIKLVHQPGWSSLMQIISLISERNKAPTNALLAKAVEICADKGVPRLHYGVWSRRGVGSFKEHHGFQCYRVPRYHVPLTATGKAALALGLHRPLVSRLPGPWLDRAVALRAHWNAARLGKGASAANPGMRA